VTGKVTAGLILGTCRAKVKRKTVIRCFTNPRQVTVNMGVDR
jgi:hypothetical protein